MADVQHSTLTGSDLHDPKAHASGHITGGGDEIDGDQLDIDWSPSNYTPSTTPSEATNVDHLTAHLYGIDQALGSLGGGGDWTLITDSELGSAQSSLAFSSLPSTYKHLKLICSILPTALMYLQIQMNGLTGSYYDYSVKHTSSGTWSNINADNQTVGILAYMASVAGQPSLVEITFPDYRDTAFDLMAMSLAMCAEATAGNQRMEIGLCRYDDGGSNYRPLTQFTLSPSSGNFDTGSYFSLYGLG